MKEFMGDYGFIILGGLIAIVLLFGFAAIYDSAQCAAKTADIGYSSRWHYMSGCMIEVTPDQWIPLDSYYFKQE